jgi:segregation and condensation protein A
MKEINLDIAGEFLVMASTLAHIKSRLLLPRQEAQGEVEVEEPGDPRAELVRRLLEYQKYKGAAESLGNHGVLERDVFVRKVATEPVPLADDEVGLVEISVYKLIEALDRVLKAAAPQIQHEITRERVSLGEAIHRVADRLREEKRVSFYTLFEPRSARHQIIITFLAVLEMCKLKMIRVIQEEGEGESDIILMARGDSLELPTPEVDENEYR